MTWLDLLLRLVVALACGALIGIERQYRQHSAGLRTSALVATGSALFVLVAAFTPSDSSPLRVAAQVVSGVGFLCAGVIIHDGLSIRGLNTAGTLWCASGIGVLAGSGYELIAVLGAVVVLLANLVLRPLARTIDRHSQSREQTSEIPVHYVVRAVCLSQQENHIRSLLLHGVSGNDLILQALQSADTQNPSRVKFGAGSLTMIATVHLYYGKLPGARITLYKAICEVFLSRRVEVFNSPQELRAEQRQLVLQPLAYTLMQEGRREISREEARPILAKPLQLVSTTLTSQDFLDHLEANSSGLLLEREQGVYSFAHQSFQEYLAMIHIQENHLEHELLTHVEESWWHETILLFCAQTDATAVLEACISQTLPSLEALTLAIDCVEEARTVKAEVKERLYMLLEQGVNDADPERRRVIAGALLKRRLRQMRPLQDRTFVDTSLVTCAEYQLFLDEQRTRGRSAAPDTWSEDTFPPGHGRDALLEVRVQDAQAFCHWLTERDQEGQSYRLPRWNERQQIKVSVGALLPQDSSYWEEDGTLIWSHNGPSQALLVQALDARARARARALTLAIEIYSIIFLFIHRPKGMRPTYEGILLIKERTSETSRTS